MRYPKLKIVGLVWAYCGVGLGLVFACSDFAWARRVRTPDILGGARLVFYTPEGKEIARFNEAGWETNVPEGQKKRQIGDFLEDHLNKYGSLLVKTRLNGSGRLIIASLRAGFGNNENPPNPYADLLVEAKLEKSLEPGGAVTDLWFLEKDGSRAEFVRDKNGNVIIDGITGEKVAGHQEFSAIYKAETKELISAYYSWIDDTKIDEHIKKYGSLLVKTRLNGSGQLAIAGQRAGFGNSHNPPNPYADLLVEAKLEKSLEPGGAVTDLWFLEKDGSRAEFVKDKNGNVIIDGITGEKVAGHQEFSAIYKAETKELISAYYSWIDDTKIDEHIKKYGSLLVKTRLDRSGQLAIAGQRAGFGDSNKPNNPYAGLLVEAKLVKSQEEGGSVMEVWFYDKGGKLTEIKKFAWFEDSKGNIIKSVYKLRQNTNLDFKEGFIYVPENRRGVIALPQMAIRVSGVKSDDLLRVKIEKGNIVEVTKKAGNTWAKVEYKEIKDRTIHFKIEKDNKLVINGLESKGVELSLEGINKDASTEEKAMELALRYEKEQKREAIDISKWQDYGAVGFDILSHGTNEEREIEVKGSIISDGRGRFGWTANQIATGVEEGDKYYLYIVVINGNKAWLYEIRDPYEKLKHLVDNGGD